MGLSLWGANGLKEPVKIEKLPSFWWSLWPEWWWVWILLFDKTLFLFLFPLVFNMVEGGGEETGSTLPPSCSRIPKLLRRNWRWKIWSKWREKNYKLVVNSVAKLVDSPSKYSGLSEVKVYFPHIKCSRVGRSRTSGEILSSPRSFSSPSFISQPLGSKKDRITLKEMIHKLYTLLSIISRLSWIEPHEYN